MEYWPDSLVRTERVFSMSTGLDASTMTPGMTAPEESLTVPTIEAWAWAMAGMTTSAARTRIAFTNLCIVTSKVLTALPGALFSSDEPAFPPLCGRGGSSAGSRQHLMKCFTSRWRLWGRRRNIRRHYARFFSALADKKDAKCSKRHVRRFQCQV